MDRKKKIIVFSLLLLVSAFFLFPNITVQAAGFVDNALSDSNLYSRYDVSNYQLDFYVDSASGWLPWNWDETIGQSVMYGIYALTNVLWLFGCLLAQGAGYLISEAFSLDFIGDMSTSIGKNIQTLAGVTSSGFTANGFYSGCLLLIIAVVGVYVLYVGAFKRETTKAFSAVISFIVIFILSAVLIGYAPESIAKVNEFSRDMTGAAMNLGLQMMGEDIGSDGTTEDSTASIRDTLWRIQVDAPWELLQFGSIDEVDSERVEGLKSTSPDEEAGKTREDIVKAEVTEQDNMNLSMSKVMSRLGMVFFLFLISLVISVFVLLLASIMIFSQLLFIITATYLPISFLLSMIPGSSGMAKKAVLSMFNTILLRVGITLIVMVTFSISYMLYQAVGTYPFLLVGFVQIIVFVGTFLSLPELLRMVTLQNGEERSRGMLRQMTAMTMLMRRKSGWGGKFGRSKEKNGQLPGRSEGGNNQSQGNRNGNSGSSHAENRDNLHGDRDFGRSQDSSKSSSGKNTGRMLNKMHVKTEEDLTVKTDRDTSSHSNEGKRDVSQKSNSHRSNQSQVGSGEQRNNKRDARGNVNGFEQKEKDKTAAQIQRNPRRNVVKSGDNRDESSARSNERLNHLPKTTRENVKGELKTAERSPFVLQPSQESRDRLQKNESRFAENRYAGGVKKETNALDTKTEHRKLFPNRAANDVEPMREMRERKLKTEIKKDRSEK